MSLATGSELTPETFNDFIERLKYHCVGSGVNAHCTANAIFRVEAKKYIYGIDPDYTEQLAIIVEDRSWHSIQEYLDDCDEDEIAGLNAKAQEDYSFDFACIAEQYKYALIAELDNHTVTGWDEQWAHVTSHFTQEAADAFIKRKSHDYRDGLRVYVDAQLYCWEWNAIKEALINGQLVFKTTE